MQQARERRALRRLDDDVPAPARLDPLHRTGRGPEHGHAEVEPRVRLFEPLRDDAREPFALNRGEPTGKQLLAVGTYGHILRSTDGKHWEQVPSPISSMINRVRMLDEKTGWAVGHDVSILRTDDGGNSWKLQHFDGKVGRPLYDIHMADAQNGITTDHLLTTKLVLSFASMALLIVVWLWRERRVRREAQGVV